LTRAALVHLAVRESDDKAVGVSDTFDRISAGIVGHSEAIQVTRKR
jgi:hypothetical protein